MEIKKTFYHDPNDFRERRLVFEAAENLDDLQSRAAEMTLEEAKKQLTYEEYQAAQDAGWFKDSLPPDGIKPETKKPKLEVLKGGKEGQDQAESTEGLDEAKKAEYPRWMQEELARMDGSVSGNIMEVSPANINVMQHVLGQRDDITRVLGTNEDVINRLVTEDLRAQIENLVKKIHESKYGKDVPISEGKLKRETEKRMYAEKLSNRASHRIRGPLYRGHARELNSLSAINVRIAELDRLLTGTHPARLRATPISREVLETERRELVNLREAWHASEKNIRTELSLVKNTKTEYLNQTWGFINPEFRTNPDGSQTSSLEDWFSSPTMEGFAISNTEQDLFRKVLEEGNLKKLLLDGDTATATGDFYTWLNGSSYNTSERNTLRAFYAYPEFKTYRELKQITNNDDLRNWNKTDEGRLMLGFLSNPQNHVYLHGGPTVPPGYDNPIEVVGVLQEMRGEEAIENIDAELTKATTKQERLRRKIEGVPTATPAILGLRQRMENAKSAMEAEEILMRRYQNHLETVKSGKARELQEEWNKLNNKQIALNTDIGTINLELSRSSGGTSSASDANARAKTRELLLTRKDELAEVVNKKSAKEDEMGKFYSDSHPTRAAYSRRRFANFESDFKTDIFAAGSYGTASPTLSDVNKNFADAKARFDDAQRKYQAVETEFNNVNTEFTEVDSRVHSLELKKATKEIPESEGKKNPERQSVATVYERLRAKQREAAMAAELGKSRTSDLTAAEKKQCLTESRGTIDQQKNAMKQAEGGKRAEGVLSDYLEQRPDLARSFTRFVLNAPRRTWDYVHKPWNETLPGRTARKIGKATVATGKGSYRAGSWVLGNINKFVRKF